MNNSEGILQETLSIPNPLTSGYTKIKFSVSGTATINGSSRSVSANTEYAITTNETISMSRRIQPNSQLGSWNLPLSFTLY